jgi:hypothetical protein
VQKAALTSSAASAYRDRIARLIDFPEKMQTPVEKLVQKMRQNNFPIQIITVENSRVSGCKQS